MESMAREDPEGEEAGGSCPEARAKIIESWRQDKPLPEAPEPREQGQVLDLMAARQELARKAQASRGETDDADVHEPAQPEKKPRPGRARRRRPSSGRPPPSPAGDRGQGDCEEDGGAQTAQRVTHPYGRPAGKMEAGLPFRDSPEPEREPARPSEGAGNAGRLMPGSNGRVPRHRCGGAAVAVLGCGGVRVAQLSGFSIRRPTVAEMLSMLPSARTVVRTVTGWIGCGGTIGPGG